MTSGVNQCNVLCVFRVFSHANIHGVFSWINTPDYMFLLSELTPQLGTLYEVLHSMSDVKLEASQMARMAANIASGMEFLCSRGDGTEHIGFQLTSKSVIVSIAQFSFCICMRAFNAGGSHILRFVCLSYFCGGKRERTQWSPSCHRSLGLCKRPGKELS